MNQSGFVLECDFAFKCPEKWENLTILSDPVKRYCSACEREVFFITSRSELEAHKRLGHCVAASVQNQESGKMITIAGGTTPSGAALIHTIGDQENTDELTAALGRIQGSKDRNQDSDPSGESQA